MDIHAPTGPFNGVNACAGTRKPPDSDHAQATAAYLELLEGRMDKRNGGSSIQTQPHGKLGGVSRHQADPVSMAFHK